MAPLGGAEAIPRPRTAACIDPRADMPPRLCIICAAEDGTPPPRPRGWTPPPRTPRPAAAPRPRDEAIAIGDAPRPLTMPPLDGVGIPRTPLVATGDPRIAPRVAIGAPRPGGWTTPRPRAGGIPPPLAPRGMGDPREGDPRILAGEPLVLAGTIGEGLGPGAIRVGAGTVMGLPL
jgi:hypothetical protein